MTKNLITTVIFCLFLHCSVKAQVFCDLNNYQTIYALNMADYPYLSSTGITVTAVNTGTTYATTFTSACGANTTAVTIPATAFWIMNVGNALTFTFSIPVTNFSILINGTDPGEEFTITSNNGVPALSNFCAANYVVTGNAISCNVVGIFNGAGTLVTIDNPLGATQYTVTLTAQGFNGSLVALLDCINGCVITNDTTAATICQGQTYSVAHKNYSTTGIYVDTFKNVDDCDSIITTILTVNPTYNTYLDTAIYEGDSITIAGIHHKYEGTYNYRFQTILNCDSNFTLRLKVIPWKLDTLKPHICIGEKFYLDTIMYDRTGVYFDTFRYEWGHHFYRTELTVHPLPIITITPNPKNPDFICVHDSLDITAKGAVYYEWYYITPKEELRFGDTTDKQTAYLFYDNTTIRVLGRDEWNCENTKEVSIKGEHCCRIFAPNAFSPNGDGLNDKFEVYSQSLPHEYRLEVFNRYGQSIFVSNNIRHKWDGTLYNGDFAPNDTYFYIISGKCSNFEPIFQKGDITLIR